MVCVCLLGRLAQKAASSDVYAISMSWHESTEIGIVKPEEIWPASTVSKLKYQ